MAENRRSYALTSQLDLEQILRDARNRWLRPVEVCEILRNHQKFTITAEPPTKPSAGSLFLFDRKALRYFRKDGHNWRKKKDGKTVREAHEKLKAGSVDVLHCYYAHGQDNENFQRRCYWMLDGQYEHIVFVHYREVKESNRSAVRSARNDRGIPNEDVREQQFSVDSTIHSSTLPSQSTYASSPSTADWNGTPEYEDGESPDDIVTSTPIGLGSSSADQASCQTHISTTYAQAHRDFSTNQSNGGTCSLYPSNQHNDQSMSEFYIPKGIKNSCNTPPMRLEETGCYQSQQTSLLRRQEGNGNTVCQNYEKNLWLEGLNDSFFVLENSSHQSTSNDREFPIIATSNEDSQTSLQVLNGVGSHKSSWGCVSNATDDSQSLPTMQTQSIIDSEHQNNILIANGLDFYKETTQNSESVDADLFLSKGYQSGTCQPEAEKCIKKLDSFGQWMSREMGESDSLVASDSGTYWNTLDNQSGMEEVSSLSHQMHLDVVSMAPSISQDQLFSVVDFSPDWSYSDFETKILITGNFLGSPQDLQKYKWSCMFGEIEVPAEVLSFSVLRCYAPRHIPGRVPFYITCSNRLACSEVREFEYRSLHPEDTNSSYDEQQLTETLLLQIRFVKLLSVSIDEKGSFCTVDNCEKCNIKEKVYFLKNEEEDEWGYSEDPRKPIKLYIREHQEKLLEKLLKEKLHDWLIWKLHDGDKGANIFDDKGQGVIHLAAALGYEWAILPIITAGVSVNFRDIRGWTALHWAAYYGREDTVVMLVTLGASAGAVTDPTPKFPPGRTPADLASHRGHKGISGFLAESHLTNHFYTLSMKESVKDNINASLDVEKTAGSVFDVVSTMTCKGDTELEYKGTLQALRNSEQAAARIQTVYRMNSLRMKQRAASDDPNSEILTGAALLTSSKQKSHRFSHHHDALHSAASRIQHKYRGWKGRREFLLLRSRIVKIQAHIRGHNVRKEYKKVVWSVGIVEKAVLRWRRKGVGLRGFRAEAAADHTVVKEDGGTNEYDYLREGRKQTIAGVEKALARVQSMARYPEARDQYQRLQISYQNKVNNQKLIDADNSCKEKGEAGSSDLKML